MHASQIKNGDIHIFQNKNSRNKIFAFTGKIKSNQFV